MVANDLGDRSSIHAKRRADVADLGDTNPRHAQQERSSAPALATTAPSYPEDSINNLLCRLDSINNAIRRQSHHRTTTRSAEAYGSNNGSYLEASPNSLLSRILASFVTTQQQAPPPPPPPEQRPIDLVASLLLAHSHDHSYDTQQERPSQGFASSEGQLPALFRLLLLASLTSATNHNPSTTSTNQGHHFANTTTGQQGASPDELVRRISGQMASASAANNDVVSGANRSQNQLLLDLLGLASTRPPITAAAPHDIVGWREQVSPQPSPTLDDVLVRLAQALLQRQSPQLPAAATTANPARHNGDSTAMAVRLLAAAMHSTAPSSDDEVATEGSLSLSLPSDQSHLSEYQICVRRQLEFFIAQQEDVGLNIQGRKKQICLYQVGIRCIHCASLPLGSRTKGAVYYPARLTGVYQAAQNMATSHLMESCLHIGDDTKQLMRTLRERRDMATGGKLYWAETCVSMGMFETETGLRLRRIAIRGSKAE